MLTIPEALAAQRRTAASKAAATQRLVPYLVQSMLGGAFIGVAVVLMLSAAGPLRAAGSPWAPLVQGLVFGVALTLVVAAGAELATSNMMTLTQGAVGGATTWARAGGTLGLSVLGNLAGGVVFATMVHLSGVVAPGTPAGAMLASVLEHKAAETTGQLFWRAVLCNMLVCLAIWAAARLTSEGARLAVIFWCLLAFITSGFEHVVANMTTFSLGLLGALPETSWAEAGRNLLVVGLGNTVGGAVLVGLAYVVAARAYATPAAPDDVPVPGAAADGTTVVVGQPQGTAAAPPAPTTRHDGAGPVSAGPVSAGLVGAGLGDAELEGAGRGRA